MKAWMKKLGFVALLVFLVFIPESNIYSDSSCSISSFTMTPSGTVPLGTHVFLEGHSNCGTVKFTVNGISKAEIGQGNQTETLKTEEFGSGTLEVCFLARGDGGWENANKSCKTLYVQGSQGAPEGSSTNGHCWIKSFTASPGKVQVGNTVKLAGYGQCDGNARASKFTIDGNSFNEKGSNTNDASWNTSGYSTGSHKVCFLITSGEWDDGSKSCTTVTLKSDSQEPNAPAQGDPADNRPTAIPSTSSSNGSTSSNTTSSSSCPNHYLTFKVGDSGKVTPGPANNLRSCAGKSCKKLGEIPGGAEFEVLGGPKCADDYWWWKVSYAGKTGWTAEGNSKNAWLEKGKTSTVNNKESSENENTNNIEQINLYYKAFDFTYHLEVDKNTCTVINGTEVLTTELNRFTDWLADSISLASGTIKAATYLTTTMGKVNFLQNYITRQISILTDCGMDDIHYDVSGYCMDMSGLGNVGYGYFLILVPNIIDDFVADKTQGFNPGSWKQFHDNPDDIVQRRMGEYIADEIIHSRANLDVDLIKKAAEKYGLFCMD